MLLAELCLHLPTCFRRRLVRREDGSVRVSCCPLCWSSPCSLLCARWHSDPRCSPCPLWWTWCTRASEAHPSRVPNLRSCGGSEHLGYCSVWPSALVLPSPARWCKPSSVTLLPIPTCWECRPARVSVPPP